VSDEQRDELEADDGDAADCWDCGGDGFYWSVTDDLGCGGEDGYCSCGGCYRRRCDTCEGRGFLRLGPDAPAPTR